jgi:potassium efflux system protein
MQRRVVKIFSLIGLLLALLALLPGTGAAQQTSSGPAAARSGEKEKAAAPLSLADFIPWATGLGDRLTVLKTNIGALVDLSATGEKLQALSKEVDGISGHLEKLKASERYEFDQLAEIKSALRLQGNTLAKVFNPLSAAINQMGMWEKAWGDENARAKEFRTSLPKGTAMAISTVRPVLDQAQKTIDTALALIAQQLKPMLEAQRKAGELQARISSLDTEVDGLIRSVRRDLLQRSDPTMFSSEYYDELGQAELSQELRRGIGLVSWPGREFFVRHGWTIFLQCLVALVLAVSIYRHRPFLEQTERWVFLAKHPVAAGLFVSLATIGPFQERPPGAWVLLVWGVACIAFARLAGSLIARPWRRWILYVLTLLLILNQLFRVIALPRPLLRIYVLSVALVGLILFFWRARVSVRRGDAPLYTWMLRVGGLLLMVVLVAELGGFGVLSARLLDASLRTVFLILVARMLTLLGRGGLEWVLYSSPLKNIPLWRAAADLVASKAALLLDVVISVFIGAIILFSWGAYVTPIAAIQGVLSLGITVGTKRVTLGLVITAGALLYGALLVSWILQATLEEGPFSQRQLQAGVRISISRLIHYGFVFAGFFLALITLGFEFREFAIIAGALGVGIGFGLQAVVNNFVCGLILLFERPIKVGDSIQLGEQWGEIKRIGLRSTIVRTFDNSEIVVPNSDLVSNQVTNWTLSDRKSRITLPVGVAYGSDVTLVMRTLLESVKDNRLVLKIPDPQVVFSGFGQSSLDFRLMVWIADVDDRLRAQTEILQEIDRRFRELGIEIPFPQQDLHLRTVADSASRVLMGSAPSSPGPTARRRESRERSRHGKEERFA